MEDTRCQPPSYPRRGRG